MALRLCLSKLEILNLSTWCVRRTIQTSSTIAKQDQERKKKISPHLFKPKWKEVEAVPVWMNITVKELSNSLGKDINHVLEVLTYIRGGTNYRRPNDVIDNFNIVKEIVKKSGKRAAVVGKPTEEPKEERFIELNRRSPAEYIDVRKRNPVVTIMGHVDHGKTTLLDSLRKSTIVDSEFGGITQHIGAFNVSLGKEKITFLDTPGHAAFCSMRNRGAQCTDIVVLVVAADDGVMNQTVESIKMAKSANVSMIVAINKIDKPKADIESTKRMLLQHEVQIEDFGGDIQVVPISALKGTNINSLIEAILAQAEVLELKSDFAGMVEGVILESYADPYRGKLSTLLVQCGTLKKGCILIAGTSWCRVRAMFDDIGNPLLEASPSTAVQVLGWKELPSAGDVAIQVSKESEVSAIIQHREKINSMKKMEEDKVVIDKKAEEHEKKYRLLLEEKRQLGRRKAIRRGPRQKEITDDYTGPRLNIILKGDVNGSVEAILDVLETYNESTCRLDVVHYGVGPVCENDVLMSELFNAKIYAFNTGIMKDVNNRSVRHFNVIYKLVDDLKVEINKLLPQKDVEEIIGEVNVLQQFLISEGKAKVPIAGCRCVKGVVKKSIECRLVRSNETIFTGSVKSLRHLKNEVNSIKKDMECGIMLSDPDVNVQPGDTIICFTTKKINQTVNWDPGF